ncbi:MAG: penicillin-binding protein activator [Pseudomonadota bacterium]|nr:penicillin-binding protein activator [Pseudomonadota bacterium]
MNSYYSNLFPRVTLLGLILLGTACSSTPEPVRAPPQPQSTTESIDELLRQAELASGDSAAELRLQAINNLIAEGQIDRATSEIESIGEPSDLNSNLQLLFALTRAELALTQDNTSAALRWLTSVLTESATTNTAAGRNLILVRAQLFLENSRVFEAVTDMVELTESWPLDDETTLFEDLWYTLTRLDEDELNSLATDADSYELRGWIELARVYQDDQNSIRSQLDSIDQWGRIWARHSAASRLPAPLKALQQTWDNRPSHIALILPIQEPAGNAIQEGFLTAYYQALSVSREVPRISIFDSSRIEAIYSIYNQAIDSGADLIIGPLDKNLVNQIQALPEIPVPTLALNYTDNEEITDNLFQFGLAPEDEISQIVNLAWESGHRNAAVLMPDTSDYGRLQNFFIESWKDKGGQVVASTNFFGDSDYADVIKHLMAIDSSEARAERLLDLLPRRNMEFTPRRRSDIDYIFLVANPRQGRQIKPTLAFYFAENIPVFSIPSIYNGRDNQQENRDLDGIVFTDAPWILNPGGELNEKINSNLRQAQGPLQRLRAMGIDSFMLYPRLFQLAERQVDSLRGTTGILTMSENQRIHRNLEPARFEDGLAVPFHPQLTEAPK